MIDVYAFATPNSLKVQIALEEMGIEYRLNAVNLRQGEQKTAKFKALNPNEKVPVLVEHSADNDVVLSESAAILVYLAERNLQLLPQEGAKRSKVFEQLFFHASGVSPAFLQAFLVSLQASPEPELKNRVLSEVDRVLKVLEHHLSVHRYVAGDEYSIADIAHFGWLWRHQALGIAIEKFPSLARWYQEVANRPAVIKAISKTLALAE